MKLQTVIASLALCATFFAAQAASAQTPGSAGQVYVFPSNGQDADQQREDRMQCYSWAADQSGYDPNLAALSVYLDSVAPAVSADDAGDTRRPAIRSAARGALAGTIVGAISGDVGVGEGAAYGAGIGAAGGGLRNRRQTQQAEAAAATQADNLAEQTRLSLSSFGKAYKTCLEGRGYAIS